MPRRLIKRYLPKASDVKKHPQLQIFGSRLRDPNLWHLNRYSVAGAAAWGFFVAFLPVPFQMLIAALGALLFRVNLPLSVAMVWISNPVTWVPLYLPAYKLGAIILGNSPSPPGKINLEWLLNHFGPLLLGCVIIGLLGAALSWLAVMGLWRRHVKKKWAERRRLRAARSRAKKRRKPEPRSS